jgi:hypothetical protein
MDFQAIAGDVTHFRYIQHVIERIERRPVAVAVAVKCYNNHKGKKGKKIRCPCLTN